MCQTNNVKLLVFRLELKYCSGSYSNSTKATSFYLVSFLLPFLASSILFLNKEVILWSKDSVHFKVPKAYGKWLSTMFCISWAQWNLYNCQSHGFHPTLSKFREFHEITQQNYLQVFMLLCIYSIPYSYPRHEKCEKWSFNFYLYYNVAETPGNSSVDEPSPEILTLIWIKYLWSFRGVKEGLTSEKALRANNF